MKGSCGKLSPSPDQTRFCNALAIPYACNLPVVVRSRTPAQLVCRSTRQHALPQESFPSHASDASNTASGNLSRTRRPSPAAPSPTSPLFPSPSEAAGPLAGLALASALSLSLLAPEAAHASESLSETGMEALRQFLEQVDGMGAPGLLLIVVAIIFTEMVPLFPTQPLSLASGLVFGPIEGTFVVLLGVSLAAFSAFFLSRGIGKNLAQRVIAFEMAPDHHKEGDEEVNVVSKKLLELRDVVETGSFKDQLLAVLFLRLTPIVPFSASNYVIGLTSIPFPPFAIGTVLGMTGWSLLYASIGGASRIILEEGTVDLGTIITNMLAEAKGYSAIIGQVGLGLGLVLAVAFFLSTSSDDSSAVEPTVKKAKTLIPPDSAVLDEGVARPALLSMSSSSKGVEERKEAEEGSL